MSDEDEVGTRITGGTNLVLARVSDALADHLPCFLKLNKFVVFVVLK